MMLLTYCNDNRSMESPGHAQENQNIVKWRNLDEDVEYVGEEACKNCHYEIHETFHQTGMGQSFGPALKNITDAKFEQSTITDSFSGFQYKVYWDNDSTMIVEETYRKSGEIIHTRKEQIDHIVGSGQHTNSHVWMDNGYAHQAPVTFYTQKGIWDLAPGFEGGNNSRFERKLGLECISCHNAFPKFEKESVNKFYSMPTGIDCERCHGPGELHVKEKQEGILVDTDKETDYSIVNPAKLDFEYQVDLCQRCHLQGNAVLKEGKDWFSFKPGMRLREMAEVFMPVYEDKSTIIMASHPDRLVQSKCFTESVNNNKQMTCITCHNPHLGVTQTKKEYYITQCKSCHNSSEQVLCSEDPELRELKNNDCMSCHMPPSSSVDIPHVSITDHYIRIPEKDSQAETDYQKEPLGIMCRTNKKPSAETMAKAYLYYFEKFYQKTEFLDSANYYLERIAEDKLELKIHYAFLTGDDQKIVDLSRNIKSELLDPLSYYRIGQAYDHLGNFDLAIGFYEKALKGRKYDLELQNKLGVAYLNIRKLDKAEKTFRFILDEFDKMKEARNNLGFVLLVKGETNQAIKEIDKALELDPFYIPALINKSKYYLALNNIDRARQILLSIETENRDYQLQIRTLLDLLKKA